MTRIDDHRLLKPGWAGSLTDEELVTLQEHLQKDSWLAYKWGFRPSAKRRPEWAIRQVAMAGDPDRRAANVALARRKLPDSRR